VDRVALVATLFNEIDSVAQFVAGVRRQTLQPDEVVVVDGGSTDGTPQALRDAVAGERTWRIIEAPGVNISAGRNRAIAEATAPVIAVTDAGTTADDDWLERLLEPLRDPATDVSAGFFEPGGETPFERCLAAIITPSLREIDPDTFLPSSRSVAFRTAAFARAGGYPEWLSHCEDLVFDLRLKETGARFAFAPRAIVRWRARSTLLAFARQYYLYARGDGHAGLWPKRHAVRYGAYATGVALMVWAQRRTAALVPLVLGAWVYTRKFHRRIRTAPSVDGIRPLAHALVPLVTVTGDVAKMAGYAVGRLQRHRVRPHPRETTLSGRFS
jgi:glycosyltransferase involved in cell wall biosynthesis